MKGRDEEMEISYNQMRYILNRSERWFEKYCCKYALCRENDSNFVLYCHMKKWLYILLFIPQCLIHLGICLWDGGLKEFEIDPVQIWSIPLDICQNKVLERAVKVWKGE